MKQLLLSICLLSSLCAFSQEKKLLEGSDTSFWYKYTLQHALAAGLPDLSINTDSFHIRISSERYMVDIWTTTKDSVFSGSITTFATQKFYDKKRRKKKKPDKLHFLTKNINSDTAHMIYKLFVNYQIVSIPTDDSIKCWLLFLDGTGCTFETSTPSTFSVKSYGNPESQKDCDEGKIISSFLNQTESLLHTEKKFDSFIDSLPTGTYHVGGIYMITKVKN